MLNAEWEPVISQAVVSEYLFFHLAIFSGKSPLSVKTAMKSENSFNLANQLFFSASSIGWWMMQGYFFLQLI